MRFIHSDRPQEEVVPEIQHLSMTGGSAIISSLPTDPGMDEIRAVVSLSLYGTGSTDNFFTTSGETVSKTMTVFHDGERWTPTFGDLMALPAPASI